MFTFQAIHNNALQDVSRQPDVKELISMFTFQAIHNDHVAFRTESKDVKELISTFTFQTAKVRNYFESAK